MTAYNAIYKCDIIFNSETYLDTNISNNEKNFSLRGNNLIRMDHPENVKRCLIYIYYKSSLTLRVLNFTFLNEYLNLEIFIGNKF